MRDSFIFYRSFQEAINEASESEQLSIYRAISGYALNREEPELSGVAKLAWLLIKPQLDANWKRFENGCLGGAPSDSLKGNQNARKRTKNEPRTNQKRTKNEANVNVNDNVNNNIGESNDSPTSSFEVVWSLYGKKGNKKTSEKKWSKLTAAKKSKAIAYIPAYVNATPDKQYRKNFETFINQECWNDELPDVKQTNKQTSNETTNRNFV